jgi:hypothetical protein
VMQWNLSRPKGHHCDVLKALTDHPEPEPDPEPQTQLEPVPEPAPPGGPRTAAAQWRQSCSTSTANLPMAHLHLQVLPASEEHQMKLRPESQRIAEMPIALHSASGARYP